MTKLAFECPMNWNAMTPAEGGRHCDACNKTVLDVRDKTRAQFDAMCASAKSNGELCVRAHANAQGELVFMSARKRRLPLVAQATFAVALAACVPNAPQDVQQTQVELDRRFDQVVMGAPTRAELPPLPSADAGTDAEVPEDTEEQVVVPPTPQPTVEQPERPVIMGRLPAHRN